MNSKNGLIRVVYIMVAIIIFIPLSCEYVLSGNEVQNDLIYRIYMLFIGIATIWGAKMMFEQLFRDKISAMFGAIFYVTCPYRLYVCYDKFDAVQMMIWVLVPFGVWGIVEICRKKRKVSGLLVSVFSCLGSFGLTMIVVMRYDGLGEGSEGGLLRAGYHVCEFFSSWFYSADRPGLGLGLLGAVLVFLWLIFSDASVRLMRRYVLVIILSGIMLLLSLMFPFCFGFASMSLCVMGAYGVECARKDERLFVKVAVPTMIFVATVSMTVYMCNMLVYKCVPVYLTNIF